jgi:hypothetical protein
MHALQLTRLIKKNFWNTIFLSSISNVWLVINRPFQRNLKSSLPYSQMSITETCTELNPAYTHILFNINITLHSIPSFQKKILTNILHIFILSCAVNPASVFLFGLIIKSIVHLGPHIRFT